MTGTETETQVQVEPVSTHNWRAVAALCVRPEQSGMVNTPLFNLALCRYSPAGWSPLAVRAGEDIVGFMMWAVDPDDDHCWLGGIMIDQHAQGRGYGKGAVLAALEYLRSRHGFTRFALSYQPENDVAAAVYRAVGFRETTEYEDDEIIARLQVQITP